MDIDDEHLLDDNMPDLELQNPTIFDSRIESVLTDGTIHKTVVIPNNLSNIPSNYTEQTIHNTVNIGNFEKRLRVKENDSNGKTLFDKNKNIFEKSINNNSDANKDITVLNGYVINNSLLPKLEAVLIENNLLSSRYDEEIVNKKNVILQSAVHMLQGFQRDYEMVKLDERKKRLRRFIDFMYNIYSLCLPPGFRNERNASTTFIYVIENFFKIRVKSQEIMNFQNIYYQRQRRLGEIQKPEIRSPTSNFNIEFLKMLGSCKKAVDMIEYLINSRNGENLRYLQENFDLLYDLDIRRREKKKSFTLNVDLIRNSFQQVKKYYLKNFTMSQGLNNDESNFEEMLNKIFFEEGMEAPIKKYTYVTTISNGIFYREYPN
uniref:Uncharacterized protein n=1 Tax=Strongyloides papillosus TaxID=174720 RepID=A0A0N5BQ42_STREA